MLEAVTEGTIIGSALYVQSGKPEKGSLEGSNTDIQKDTNRLNVL